MTLMEKLDLCALEQRGRDITRRIRYYQEGLKETIGGCGGEAYCRRRIDELLAEKDRINRALGRLRRQIGKQTSGEAA